MSFKQYRCKHKYRLYNARDYCSPTYGWYTKFYFVCPLCKKRVEIDSNELIEGIEDAENELACRAVLGEDISSLDGKAMLMFTSPEANDKFVTYSGASVDAFNKSMSNLGFNMAEIKSVMDNKCAAITEEARKKEAEEHPEPDDDIPPDIGNIV